MNGWLVVSLALNGLLLWAWLATDIAWANALEDRRQALDCWRATLNELEAAHCRVMELRSWVAAQPPVFPGDEWKN